MKYVANPIEVEAFRILSIGQVPEGVHPPSPRVLHLDNDTSVTATSEMMSRYVPVVGDYWVIPEYNYPYISSVAVFEKNYHSTGVQKPAPVANILLFPSTPPAPVPAAPSSDENLRRMGFTDAQIQEMEKSK